VSSAIGGAAAGNLLQEFLFKRLTTPGTTAGGSQTSGR
jgi:hypothetical protein